MTAARRPAWDSSTTPPLVAAALVALDWVTERRPGWALGSVRRVMRRDVRVITLRTERAARWCNVYVFEDGHAEAFVLDLAAGMHRAYCGADVRPEGALCLALMGL